MTFTRRTLLTLAIATGLAGVAQAQAPAWPTAGKPIRIVAALPGRLGHRRQRCATSASSCRTSSAATR
jgi:hypothetical protein